MVIRRLAVAFWLAAAGVPAGAAEPSSTPLQTADAADDLKPQIDWAEAWGRAVFDAYKVTSKVSDLAMDTALATAATAVTDKCAQARYRAVIVTPPGMPADRFAVYYIGTVPKDQGLLIGRHYRIEVSGDGKTALSVAPSSKTCLVIPPPPAGTAEKGTVTTHLLTPAPSEFHVFLSLLTGQPIYVGTKSGIWQVDKGRIQLLKAN